MSKNLIDDIKGLGLTIKKAFPDDYHLAANVICGRSSNFQKLKPILIKVLKDDIKAKLEFLEKWEDKEW